MNIAPKTCKISKGTTLEELAAYFHLTPDQLKWYHNTYCPLADLIGYDIPEHVRIIYVPPTDEASREKIFNPKGGNYINYSRKNTLDNRGSFAKQYGIIHKVFQNGEEKSNIHYETEIIKRNNKVEVKRNTAFVDYESPDLTIEQMAAKAGEIIFPLELGLHENGTIKEIHNQQEILNRWIKLRQQFEDYYKGEEAEALFQKIHGNIRRQKKVFTKYYR